MQRRASHLRDVQGTGRPPKPASQGSSPWSRAEGAADGSATGFEHRRRYGARFDPAALFRGVNGGGPPARLEVDARGNAWASTAPLPSLARSTSGEVSALSRRPDGLDTRTRYFHPVV